MTAPGSDARPAISDSDCVAFLQWALPRLGLRWAGYRKVRGTLRKRLRRRLRHLGLPDLAAYRARLAAQPAEWQWLQTACRIPISRFFRDRRVFERLGEQVLPSLARAAQDAGRNAIDAWSAGCASGEEPYSLAILWRLGPGRDWPGLKLHCVATDADAGMLRRAAIACYGAGSLKDIPPPWRDASFVTDGDRFCLRPEFRSTVCLRQADIRQHLPPGPFDLILCRNLVFTYFAPAVQVMVLTSLCDRLRPNGVLVLGTHEQLPAGPALLARVAEHLPIYRKAEET